MFRVGNQVRFDGEFRDHEDNLTDPTDVMVTVTTPAGSDTYAVGRRGVQRDDVGRYHVDVALDVAGVVSVKFSGTSLSGDPIRHQLNYQVVDADAEAPAPPRADARQAAHREQMIAALRAAGVAVDEARSDGFISAAHAELLRTQHAARMRSGSRTRD